MSESEQQAKPAWQFDNSYLRLPEQFYSRVDPEPVSAPRLVILNRPLYQALGLPLDAKSEPELAELLSGNRLPTGAESIAQAYSGHQFGHFTNLGDGRAHLIGEHIAPSGERVDIQLKGSGRTPYGRRGDGRAALGPMLREYVISEALQALGVATTRSLAVVATGDTVYRESALPGAILTRVSASHLRVGTFEHFASLRDTGALRQLADYAIERHYPLLQDSPQPYLDLIGAVMARQIELVVDWMRIGFIHGVMNTDNMTISGQSIDFGPCAFMDEYDPQTVFSSIDHAGRYAFANQPSIVQWNLARFAEALLPLISDDIDAAAEQAGELISAFGDQYRHNRLAMLRRKLGLVGEQESDQELADSLLEIMQHHQADYTNTFRALADTALPAGEFYHSDDFTGWRERWQQRLLLNGTGQEAAQALMNENNPAFIPRNHRVAAALDAAENEADFSVLQQLLEVLSQPYHDNPAFAEFKHLPGERDRVLHTFCGT